MGQQENSKRNSQWMSILHLQYEGFPTTRLAEHNWFYIAYLKKAAPVQLTSEKGLDFFKMGIGATVCYIFLYIFQLSDPTL